ncbi:MAG: hypothetical protein PHI97_28185 [Desulfobulbus sp.]|nr:hypothetical protein [Desulfobulbus sp.]
MNMKAGIWIDHRKAIIVLLSAQGEETLKITSNVEKHQGRNNGTSPTVPFEAQLVKADDSQERKFTAQLDQYYTEVTKVLSTAESILIFGPGEAKGELKRHLEDAKLGETIIAVETSDKMTDPQISAKVREYFKE